jgi:hypothetical protein
MSGAIDDEREVRNLIMTFARLTDAGSLEDYGSFVADNATWTSPTVPPVVGRPAIVAAAAERRENGVTGPGSATCHVVSNVVVRVNADTAEADAIFQYFDLSGAAPSLRAMGTYQDTFVRIDKTWQFLSRHIAAGAPTVR